MARKWIADRIAELDPATDYDEIWRLAAAQRPTDFMMNLIYAVTFPHFLVREGDAVPVVRGGKGKILTNPHKRADDTSYRMQLWWHYGSHHEETRKNVEALNRLHASYAKTYPDSGFASNDAYLYTLCYEAAGMHRLLRRVGLPGISENEQLAAVPYWRQMGTLFRNVVTGGEVTGFPDTFEGIMGFMDRYEAEQVPQHEAGKVAARAIIGQFADRYFPTALHPAVRTWIISLYPDHLVAAFDLPKPAPWVRTSMRLLTAALFVVGEKVLPDPHDTFLERRGAAKGPAASSAKPFSVGGACPHAGGRVDAQPTVGGAAVADSVAVAS